ncbi:hypothetical protein SUGI_1206530 [Cryptomeria japonica]|nr:hypothetical protein SUGI_1206530 [Cryptomeria japonica]
MFFWVVVGFGMYPFLYSYVHFFQFPYLQLAYIVFVVGGVFVISQKRGGDDASTAEPVQQPSPSSSCVDMTAVEMGVFTYRHHQQKEEEEHEECVICLCEYQDEDAVAALPPCQHNFHVDCIRRWLECQPRCPICNACPLQKLVSAQKNDALHLLPLPLPLPPTLAARNLTQENLGSEGNV